MGLFDFIDTTFILTLGIILLISGGIMIYCYRRLNTLENGLIQQGRVMQEFIANYNLNTQLMMGNRGNNNTHYLGQETNIHDSNNENKILVSDNEDSDNNSDSNNDSNNDSDNDSDSDSDSDSDDDNNKHILVHPEENIEKLLTDKIEDKTIENNDKDVEITNLDNILINGTDLKELVLDDLNNLDVSNIDQKKLIPISDTDGQDISKKNPNRLKVDELRELVVSKNLISNDDAQKLKKNDLIKLLE